MTDNRTGQPEPSDAWKPEDDGWLKGHPEGPLCEDCSYAFVSGEWWTLPCERHQPCPACGETDGYDWDCPACVDRADEDERKAAAGGR